MIRLQRWFSVLLLAGLLGFPATGGHARSSPAAPLADEVTTIQNDYIQVLVDEKGLFVIGTLEGDPGTPADDNKKLMYGYGDNKWTSFTSIRLETGSLAEDIPLYVSPPARPPTVSGDSVSIFWAYPDVEVEQTISPADNPFTNRRDTVKIATAASNTGRQATRVGVRVMLDTMIGENDDAPFFIPGTGNTNQEQEYMGTDIPSYWKAFEAADYDPDRLKGQGILSGFGATPPDRFLVASWPYIVDTVWDYAITPAMETGDSAVAVYWLPQELEPGESVTWVTYYGLAGSGGGASWFDAPVVVTSQNPDFETTLWVSNKSDADFVGGEATLTLPPGLLLATEESVSKPLPRVLMNGDAQSVSWRLIGTGGANVDYSYSATTVFESGSSPLTTELAIRYQWVPTPTPAHTLTPTATPTPTTTPTPTPTPTRVPLIYWPTQGEFPCLPLIILLPLLLLGLLLWLLRARRRRPPSRPVTRPSRPSRPTPPSYKPVERPKKRDVGKDVTHGRKRGP